MTHSKPVLTLFLRHKSYGREALTVTLVSHTFGGRRGRRGAIREHNALETDTLPLGHRGGGREGGGGGRGEKKRERERERVRDRQTERVGGGGGQRQTDRQRDRDIERQRQSLTDRQRQGEGGGGRQSMQCSPCCSTPFVYFGNSIQHRFMLLFVDVYYLLCDINSPSSNGNKFRPSRNPSLCIHVKSVCIYITILRIQNRQINSPVLHATPIYLTIIQIEVAVFPSSQHTTDTSLGTYQSEEEEEKLEKKKKEKETTEEDEGTKDEVD